MRLFTILTAGAAFLLSAVSCGKSGYDEKNNPYKSLELTTKSVAFVEKGSAFTFDFIARIDAFAQKDYIISPLSMQILLGMILDGAQGATAEEICKVLGYGAGETDAVNEYCLSMLKQLPALDKKTQLSMANAIFVDDGWPLLDSYKSTVRQYYQAEVSNLDFTDNAGSLKAINGWCKDHTNGLIPKILDQVDPNMLAYLLNAMYFKSQWKEKFPKNATAQEAFTKENGAQGKVPMMKQEKDYSYDENDIYQVVRLPYGNGAFSMYVFLPRGKNGVADVAGALKKSDWNSVRYNMETCEVDLWLPKFETTYHIKLNDILSEMGMPSSFDPERAHFKAMSEYALCLSFVQQDAVIKVDEEGSEAAVVSSAGMMKEASLPPGAHVVFHADHPFLYLIAESSTGAVLFAGRYSGE